MTKIQWLVFRGIDDAVVDTLYQWDSRLTLRLPNFIVHPNTMYEFCAQNSRAVISPSYTVPADKATDGLYVTLPDELVNSTGTIDIQLYAEDLITGNKMLVGIGAIEVVSRLTPGLPAYDAP